MSVLGAERPRAGLCSESPSPNAKNSVPPALGLRGQLPSLEQMLEIARVATGASGADQVKCPLFPQLPRLASRTFAGFRCPSKHLDLQFWHAATRKSCAPRSPALKKVSQVLGLLGSRPCSRETRLTSHRPRWLEDRGPCLPMRRPYTHTGRGPGGHGPRADKEHGSGNFVKNAETARTFCTFPTNSPLLLQLSLKASDSHVHVL